MKPSHRNIRPSQSGAVTVLGGYLINNNCHVSAVTSGAEVTQDPFASRTMPALSSCTYVNYKNSGNRASRAGLYQ